MIDIAEDVRLVDKAGTYDGEIVWFSLDAASPVVTRHIAAGGTAFVLHGDELCMLDSAERTPICRSDDIPLALGGAARHNVANALSAAALTWSMGVSLDAIARGLTTMRQDVKEAGETLVEVLLQLVETGKEKSRLLEPRLIVRESCGSHTRR